MIGELDRDYIRARPKRAVARLIAHLFLQGRPLTTRHQWLNPLLLAQFAAAKRLPQLRRVDRPIFILGTGRSGTTILGKVLSIHPDICFLNEPKGLWSAIYPEEDVIGTYSRGPAFYKLDAAAATPAVRRAAHRLYSYCLTLTRSQRILDKYPEMIFRVPFIEAIFPDAKLLFLVRNGWDTIHSIASWSERNATSQFGELHNWWGANNRKWNLLVEQVIGKDPDLSAIAHKVAQFTKQTDMAAVEWIVTMREGLRLRELIPAKIRIVRFEELTRHPKEEVRSILEFCELPPDHTTLAYANSTLKPVPPRKPATLDDSIISIFTETMEVLGYQSQVARSMI